MIGRIRRVLARIAQQAAALPVRALPAAGRAHVLEQLNEEMIATTRTPRGGIRFAASSPLLLSRAESVLTKESDTIRWIDGFPDDAVLWDVGANVGVFTLYAALKPKTTVLAFEPGAANYAVLCRNIQLNRLANACAYCLAFAGETRLGVLNMASAAVGTALNQFGDNGDLSPYAERSSANVVQGMIGWSMDEFIARYNPPFPQFLKIDVDGIEWPILQGAVQTLRDPRLRGIMVELSLTNHEEHDRAMELLRESGFNLLAEGEVQGTETEKAANHFFERVRPK